MNRLYRTKIAVLNICLCNDTTLYIFRFVERSNQRDYIEVFKGHPGSCWSLVGRKGGKQPLSLGEGCPNVGTVVHEFMHALGTHYSPSHEGPIKDIFQMNKALFSKSFHIFQ